MVNNYIKLIVRNLLRNKLHSFINIIGLSVGLASSILIISFIWHEMSYDNFHPDVENTYRVYCDQPGNVFMNSSLFDVMPIPFQPTVKAEYPEVKYASRLTQMTNLMSLDNHTYVKQSYYAVDQDFIEMFDVQMIYGQKENALTDRLSVLLSKTSSEKFFGNENPVGQIIMMDDSVSLVVRGVFKDIPVNSHFEYEMLIPFSLNESFRDLDAINSWDSHSVKTYLQLTGGTSQSDFEAKLVDLVKAKRGEEIDDRYYLQPVRDIHLYGKLNFELSANGDIKYIFIFGAIALFLLMIASFNYMNLATARSLRRAKEVGIRKVVGASRKQLFRQFIGEALFYTIVSLLISLILIEVFEPVFNQFIDRNIHFYSLSPIFYILVFIVVIVIALISGSYPAIYLSKFSPIHVLKGSVKGSLKSVLIRNTMVVMQFIISVVLIICTLVIVQQLMFIKNKNLGFDTDNILSVSLNSPELVGKKEVLRNELLSSSGVMSITSSDYLPSSIMSQSGFKYDSPEGKKSGKGYFIRVDYDFLNFYHIPLQKGEYFNKEMLNGKYMIINEAAEKSLGLDEIVGKSIYLGYPKRTPYKIVGVVKDFHFAPLNQEIQPACIILSPERSNRWLSVKIAKGMEGKTIPILESKIKEISPKFPISYRRLTDSIDNSYREERRLSSLFSFFTVIAVVIACLGLFGLVSFIIDQRTKEIGIRKILGASVQNIVVLLSKNVGRWLLFSNIVAWPLAWYFMDKWLQNFVYHVKLDIATFLLAGLITLLVALLTTGFQTVKTALMNPVESLKFE